MINITFNQIENLIYICILAYAAISIFVSLHKDITIGHERLCTLLEYILLGILAVLITFFFGINNPANWKKSPNLTYKYVNVVDYDCNNNTFIYTQNGKQRELKYSYLEDTTEETYAEKFVHRYTQDVLFFHITKEFDFKTTLYITQKEYNEKLIEKSKKESVVIR